MDWGRRKRFQKINQIVLVFLFFCLGATLVWADQNIRFKRLSIDDGLSQGSVNCILQDRRGFLWLGTQDGLNRYDGYEFKVFEHDPKDQSTISDNFIMVLYIDNSDTFWIGTYGGGLNKFDRKTNEFIRYRNIPGESSSLSNDYVTSIHKDRSRILWIGTYGGGLNKFDEGTKSFSSYQYNANNKKSLSHDNVNFIYEDSAGNLWIGTDDGLNTFNRDTESFTRYPQYIQEGNKLNNIRVKAIHEDKAGTFWIGTEDGLYQFERDTGSFTRYPLSAQKENSLSNVQVKAIHEDKEGALWIGTDEGLYRFNQVKRSFTHFKHDKANRHSLSHQSVLSIYENNEGILWVGTLDGLNQFYSLTKHFKLYVHEMDNPHSLSCNDVWAIYEDRQRIVWVGTYGGGLNRYDRNTGEFKYYTSDNSTLKNNDVRAICEDLSGAFWIGTFGGGLYNFDREKEQFTQYRHDENTPRCLSDNYILSIHEDRDGNLWVGTYYGGLNKFDPAREHFTQYTHSENDARSLSHNIVRTIYEDPSGILWIGTNGGLSKFDKFTNDFTSYHHDDKDQSSLSHNRVRCIYQDKMGNLWVGTLGGGLNKFDRQNGVFKSYQKKDGLPNNVIYGILEDNQGNLWLSTNKGISKFDPKTESFKNYDTDDGLQSNEFNAGAYFKNLHTGEMFFGGVKGFNSFSPEHITDDPYKPTVVITKFLLLNKNREKPNSPMQTPIDIMEPLTLTYNQNSFSFEFAAIHFAGPGKNKYKCMLKGWDEDWIARDSKKRHATYTNLPSGEYEFKVRGSNKDGIWNKEGTSIKLKILPPWWETWWAKILYILAFIMFVFLGARRYLKQKERKQARLIHDEKRAAIVTLVANIHHEINNPTGAAHTTAYNLTKTLEKLKTFLNELAGDNADAEILGAFDRKFDILFDHLDTLNESTYRIAKIVKELRTLLRKDCEMKRINVQEVLKSSIDSKTSKYREQVDFITDFQTSIEIRGNADELNLVYMNIIENACYSIVQKQKSSGDNSKGSLTIHVRQENSHAVIRFKDTGTGMTEEQKRKVFDPFFTTKPEGEGTGLGLYSSYNIVEAHRGSFDLESQVGHGTTVTVRFPLESNRNIKPKGGKPWLFLIKKNLRS